MFWSRRKDDTRALDLIGQHLIECPQWRKEVRKEFLAIHAQMEERGRLVVAMHDQNKDAIAAVKTAIADNELAQVRRANKLMTAIILAILGAGLTLATDLAKTWLEIPQLSPNVHARGS